MGNLYLLQCELNLIADGLKTYEDVRDFNRADEHDKAVMSQLHDIYLYTPTNYWDVYEGCWESEKDFATDLADSSIIPSEDVAFFPMMSNPLAYYFDYESFTYDLFISDYTSRACRQCGDLMIVRYD